MTAGGELGAGAVTVVWGLTGGGAPAVQAARPTVRTSTDQQRSRLDETLPRMESQRPVVASAKIDFEGDPRRTCAALDLLVEATADTATSLVRTVVLPRMAALCLTPLVTRLTDDKFLASTRVGMNSRLRGSTRIGRQRLCEVVENGPDGCWRPGGFPPLDHVPSGLSARYAPGASILRRLHV
jgi:hypothetical protein